MFNCRGAPPDMDVQLMIAAATTAAHYVLLLSPLLANTAQVLSALPHFCVDLMLKFLCLTDFSVAGRSIGSAVAKFAWLPFDTCLSSHGEQNSGVALLLLCSIEFA